MKTKILWFRLTFTMLVIFILTSLATAGDLKPRWRRGDTSYGGGGGPFIMWKAVDSPGLDRLAYNMGVPKLGGYLMGIGGGGYSFFGHTRVGGLGAGCTLTSTDLVGGVEHKLQVNFGYGGFLAEYITKYGPSTLSLGCLVGGGGYTVKIQEGSWEKKASKGFFFLEPCLGLRLRLAVFVAFQGWVGYLFAPTEELTIEYNNELYRLKPGEMGGWIFRLMLVFGGETH